MENVFYNFTKINLVYKILSAAAKKFSVQIDRIDIGTKVGQRFYFFVQKMRDL